MFDYLNKILFKTKTPDTCNVDGVKEFQPYLIQRWCSMYSPQVSDLINQTSNRIWPVLENNTMWFNYLHGVIPACKFKRTLYIKKKKDTAVVTSNKQNINVLANHLEISVREVNQYIELFNLKIPNEKKSTTQD